MLSRPRKREREFLSTRASWLDVFVTAIPQNLTRLASAYPIHTVVLIALLVSSAYVSLLENSLLCSQSLAALEATRQFYAGPDTAWHWHRQTSETVNDKLVDRRAIVTLQFSRASSQELPAIPLPDHLDVELLPSNLDPFSAASVEQSRAFSVAKNNLYEFLDLIQEIRDEDSGDGNNEVEDGARHKWVAATREGRSPQGMGNFILDKWAELVYLFNHASLLDVAIMATAYIAMHLTFASLFVSMYRMGSRVWLFASVLLSSTFAFVLALFTAIKLGVPVNLALLSEGLPLLVVMVGFENPIRLTQAVLEAAEHPGSLAKTKSSMIPAAIEGAINTSSTDIIKHYAVEIGLLLTGALLCPDSSLRPFCFLAALILFFDCVLLFSFYTAVLGIKLEILRLRAKDMNSIRKGSKDTITGVLGRRVTQGRIRKFKLSMITAFILINIANTSMIPIRSTTGSRTMLLWPQAKVHNRAFSSSLDAVLSGAMLSNQATMVTVIPPMILEPDRRFSVESQESPDDKAFSRPRVNSLLRSFDDPVLFKCVIAALIISVTLNGRLFAAARHGAKQSKAIDQGENFTNSTSKQTSSRRHNAEPIDGPSATEALLVRSSMSLVSGATRSLGMCHAMLREGLAHELSDEEIVALALAGKLPLHALEKSLKDFTRAVKVRRSIVSRMSATLDLTHSLETSELPYESYAWSRVFGVCCENVVGYMPVPVGLAGPLTIDNKSHFLPIATTEGVLVAGVMRGSKAINAGGGVKTVLTADGMTRGPCVTFDSLDRTAAAKIWLDSATGQEVMKESFNSTTRYGRLEYMKTAMAGANLYIRFKASTGDAMGMNMISKGVEHALITMKDHGFDDMQIISLSANYCSDKKPAAINWIDGRGKSVVAQATIPPDIVKSVLKTDVESMVTLNMDKNLIGSAMAGSIGGFNAHAANIVAAMYIATGQDPAQVVESANCITIMKNVRGSLQISVSMPSIEVGTIGGGTTLGPQRAMLDILGVRGANAEHPGDNARQLARIVAAGALAAELSLCAALAAGHLVKAHMQHNRAQ
ncbi:hydroxymethylglutaryl-coenzyme A reductase-domain-containing protein [Aspergillus undulatus]|uniref:hydroxymethylglutaryl-coenzyme A reductase-domain-containing protein n=1 Tax=Aspergillus undulatus TaxID=1810928 RepID=UPI003CCE4336